MLSSGSFARANSCTLPVRKRCVIRRVKKIKPTQIYTLFPVMAQIISERRRCLKFGELRNTMPHTVQWHDLKHWHRGSTASLRAKSEKANDPLTETVWLLRGHLFHLLILQTFYFSLYSTFNLWIILLFHPQGQRKERESVTGHTKWYDLDHVL